MVELRGVMGKQAVLLSRRVGLVSLQALGHYRRQGPQAWSHPTTADRQRGDRCFSGHKCVHACEACPGADPTSMLIRRKSGHMAAFGGVLHCDPFPVLSYSFCIKLSFIIKKSLEVGLHLLYVY